MYMYVYLCMSMLSTVHVCIYISHTLQLGTKTPGEKQGEAKQFRSIKSFAGKTQYHPSE